MTEKILVTGAAGYVGRHVVTALLDRGAEVIATVRPGSRSTVDPRAAIVPVDVLDPQLDVPALTQHELTAVVHLAWQDGFAHNAPSHMLRLSDHFRLLTALVNAGVPRIAVLGSMHEIGYWEGAIDETTPARPLSLYGIAKNALRESTLAALGARTELQWLRCYYIHGDDRNNQSVFTKILEAADQGKTSFPFTTGKNRYDFIDVGDLGRQIATVVCTPAVTGIINCCSGEPVGLREKVEEFIAVHRLPLTLEIGAFPDRPYDSPGVWGDATRIQQIMSRAAA